MEESKMYERISWYKKEYVHEQYSRIVDKFKDYDKITKKKMLEEIYKVYSDYNNIIDICSVKELKFLQMLIDKKSDVKELLKDKYEWERKTLRKKFLIVDDHDKVFLPDEMVDLVKEAIKNVNWDVAKKLNDLNEILVSYCKIQGSALLNSVCAFASGLTGIDEDLIWTHVLNNRLFNYYVMIYSKDFETIGKDIPVALYQDYYQIEEELDKERAKQGIAGVFPIDLKKFRTLFYNDFDIDNPKIKKFLDELKKLPFFWTSAIQIIREFAMLNIDREPLKKSIANVPALKDYDLSKFFKILDEAMDEMPSGALNGFSPNEANKIKAKQINMQFNKAKKYVKQQNACLSPKDAKLFYKIYFGLLDFTNKKYKINEHVKIYRQTGINPYAIKDIIDKFWENKEAVTTEFCLVNPYKFNNEELNITKEFKKGFRSMFIIARYELEYTAFMNENKTYMVKGINDNIDNIIPYSELPYIVITSILPFKGNIIYDGILSSMEIKIGSEFDEIVEKEYNTAMKYYHL